MKAVVFLAMGFLAVFSSDSEANEFIGDIISCAAQVRNVDGTGRRVVLTPMSEGYSTRLMATVGDARFSVQGDRNFVFLHISVDGHITSVTVPFRSRSQSLSQLFTDLESGRLSIECSYR